MVPIALALLSAGFLSLAIADMAIAGKPGVPGRRVGGGTRLVETNVESTTWQNPHNPHDAPHSP